jgi:hypothetical protein
MKHLVYITFLFLPLMAVSQFQPIQKADWELWDRNDHKMHMIVGQMTVFVPQLVITYFDEKNPNFVAPLKYTIPISLGLTIGKEYIWDRALGFGTPTYPDLIYGIIGTATGLILSYGLYKLERWDISKNEKKFKL